jgi:hypothetical protein
MVAFSKDYLLHKAFVGGCVSRERVVARSEIPYHSSRPATSLKDFHDKMRSLVGVSHHIQVEELDFNKICQMDQTIRCFCLCMILPQIPQANISFQLPISLTLSSLQNRSFLATTTALSFIEQPTSLFLNHFLLILPPSSPV